MLAKNTTRYQWGGDHVFVHSGRFTIRLGTVFTVQGLGEKRAFSLEHARSSPLLCFYLLAPTLIRTGTTKKGRVTCSLTWAGGICTRSARGTDRVRTSRWE
jgi:hypothetical protein